MCFFTTYSYAVVPVFQHFNSTNGLEDRHIKSIVEDHFGYMWIGTDTGVYKFDGHHFKKIVNNPLLDNIIVEKLLIGNNDELWIATKKNGLLLHKNNITIKIQSNHLNNVSILDIIMTSDDKIWIGSNRGLFNVSNDHSLIQPPLKSIKKLNNKKISAIDIYDSNTLIIATKGGFSILDINSDALSYIKLDKHDAIHDLHVDTNNNLWIASSSQLYNYNLKSKKFNLAPKLPQASRILALVQHMDDLWVASIDGGLFKININSQELTQFTHDDDFSFSLSEKNILSLYLSKHNGLWVGGFSTGLSLLDLGMLNFGYERKAKNSLYCAQSSNITSISVEDKNTIWIGNEYGLIKYKPQSSSCEQVNIKIPPLKNDHTVYSTMLDNHLVWISSSSGLLLYDQNTKTVEKPGKQLNFSACFFSLLLPNKDILIGTDSGLYQYNIKSESFHLYKTTEEKHSHISYLKYATNSKNEIFLPTTSGLLYLNQANELKLFDTDNSLFTDQEIIGIQVNTKDELYISVFNRGLYHLSSSKKLIKHYFDSAIFSRSNSIFHIQFDDSGAAWMASSKGLTYLDINNNEKHLFTGISDTNYLSLLRSSFKHDGIIYFAGNDGYVGFDPHKIDFSDRESTVMISELYLINRPIQENSYTDTGFILEQSIEKVDHLDFGYKDSLIGFEFTSLDFNNADHVKYAYKLQPTFNNWVELLPGSRHLTFTNLKSGNYNLALRATNLDRVWSNNVTNLQLSIASAPWLTWWAYLSYLLIIICGIYLYISNKINQQKKLNHYLNTQVEKQTQHIQKQKETVMQLMDRRNEIFSNVTHEFRTPITLIQGPITELAKEETNVNRLKMFEMVKRNSNRLLRLVNQMLELSQAVDNSDENKSTIKIAAKLKLIAEPYTYLAKNNNISFSIEHLDEVEICVTPDALESTIGNFLSNAIKYTQSTGTVKLGTKIKNNTVEIFVKDNGCGFDSKHKQHIFKRFGRLPQHEKIKGAGIGLALVKEIAEFNNATVAVKSTVGQGAEFSVTFPIHSVIPSDATMQQAKQAVSSTSKTHYDKNKATVLIIEDNEDMRLYIESILTEKFQCLLASNGKDGIAIALKSVPDIIISDVMMPGIDGFHVCRILRNEMITSHIPLVLLTALIDKSSRIKGWRENIDMYLCKPFDAEELNLQLKNILNIRNILNKKNSTLLKNEIYSEFSQIDEKFIRKLNGIIKKYYMEPLFTLEKMAELMFISERQLQRKTKALLNMPPLDLLRDYRFKKATQSLKKGYQVSITSDTCGFGSISYFSQSFKNRYGMTPKEYKKLNTKKIH